MTGLILINLGTPDTAETPDVRKYLAEFLMDPLVIDIPWVFRVLLVHGLILRTRPRRSAEAYQKIWTKEGSPLRIHLLKLSELVQKELGQDFLVVPAMRYGSPSIRSAVEKISQAKLDRVLVMPLYPQYSLAATESSIRKLKEEFKRQGLKIETKILPAFWNLPGFISSSVEVAKETLKEFKSDHVLFSFHGLPERHVKRTAPKVTHCMEDKSCCEVVDERNPDCYRAQCYGTAKLIAKELGLKESDYSIGFQSRLGRTPWIQPFTDHLFESLPKQGKKRLAVFCPSFVADCLETLEEIQIRGRAQFRAAGGEDLTLVPCVNSSAPWAKALSQHVAGQKNY
jgi:ferrochelatase